MTCFVVILKERGDLPPGLVGAGGGVPAGP